MRSILYVALICLLSAFSCSKNDHPRELNIGYTVIEKSQKIEDTTNVPDIQFYQPPGIIVYPNPTHGIINCALSGSQITALQITNDKGDFMKIDFPENNFQFDLSEEKSGVFYCEALIDNLVYRVQIIKL